MKKKPILLFIPLLCLLGCVSTKVSHSESPPLSEEAFYARYAQDTLLDSFVVYECVIWPRCYRNPAWSYYRWTDDIQANGFKIKKKKKNLVTRVMKYIYLQETDSTYSVSCYQSLAVDEYPNERFGLLRDPKEASKDYWKWKLRYKTDMGTRNTENPMIKSLAGYFFAISAIQQPIPSEKTSSFICGKGITPFQGSGTFHMEYKHRYAFIVVPPNREKGDLYHTAEPKLNHFLEHCMPEYLWKTARKGLRNSGGFTTSLSHHGFMYDEPIDMHDMFTTMMNINLVPGECFKDKHWKR